MGLTDQGQKANGYEKQVHDLTAEIALVRRRLEVCSTTDVGYVARAVELITLLVLRSEHGHSADDLVEAMTLSEDLSQRLSPDDVDYERAQGIHLLAVMVALAARFRSTKDAADLATLSTLLDGLFRLYGGPIKDLPVDSPAYISALGSQALVLTLACAVLSRSSGNAEDLDRLVQWADRLLWLTPNEVRLRSVAESLGSHAHALWGEALFHSPTADPDALIAFL